MTLATLLLFTSSITAIFAAAVGGEGMEGTYAQWTCITLGGGLASGGAAFWLNPDTDDRRKVLGRAIIAAVAAVFFPRLLYKIGPFLADPMEHPILCYAGYMSQFLTTDLVLLFGTACAFGGSGYAISPPIVNWFFHRLPKKLIDRADNFIGSTNDKTPPTPPNITP